MVWRRRQTLVRLVMWDKNLLRTTSKTARTESALGDIAHITTSNTAHCATSNGITTQHQGDSLQHHNYDCFCLQPLQSADRLAQSGVGTKQQSRFESSRCFLTLVGDAEDDVSAAKLDVMAWTPRDATRREVRNLVRANHRPLDRAHSHAICPLCHSVIRHSHILDVVPRKLHLLTIPLLLQLLGCGPSERPEHLWGKRGVRNGEIVRPRAAVIDRNDRLYIVDYTARIQAYDLDGKYLDATWTTPDYRNGRPSGLGIALDGSLIVCDSHYHCLRFYSPDGTELRKVGGDPGNGPGQFGYISDVVQDDDGNLFVSEFGENDRITKLDANGKFIKSWGKAGTAEGEFSRARALALGPDGLLYVADAINHRIQVFTRDGEFVRTFGASGTEPGQLRYPYDLAFGPKGDLYIVEYENHRVSKFTKEGKWLACWGAAGRSPGKLASPWALVVDRKGRIHIIDTENHRVQRIAF